VQVRDRSAVQCYLYKECAMFIVFCFCEYQESVGIAKALAAKNGYELDSNQEVAH
jgi:MFS superfamily sulfate permease-like transporter